MASGKTLELSRRDQITIAKSVTDLGLGEPQYIGTYRELPTAFRRWVVHRNKCSEQISRSFGK